MSFFACEYIAQFAVQYAFRNATEESNNGKVRFN